MAIIVYLMRRFFGMPDTTAEGLATVWRRLEDCSIVFLVSSLIYSLGGAGGALYWYSPPPIAWMHLRADSITATVKLPTMWKNQVIRICRLRDTIFYLILKIPIMIWVIFLYMKVLRSPLPIRLIQHCPQFVSPCMFRLKIDILRIGSSNCK